MMHVRQPKILRRRTHQTQTVPHARQDDAGTQLYRTPITSVRSAGQSFSERSSKNESTERQRYPIPSSIPPIAWWYPFGPKTPKGRGRGPRRFNLRIGERSVLGETGNLEFFRNTLGDGNCFFHSVAASCLVERTLQDDRNLGRRIHSWAALGMAELVRSGVIHSDYLADYLGYSGGTLEDAIRVAETDYARPVIQCATANLINRPIAYVSRQSRDDSVVPSVDVYTPENAAAANFEPIFIAHEHFPTGSTVDGGSGHYMVLRRRLLDNDRPNVGDATYSSVGERRREHGEGLSSICVQPPHLSDNVGSRNTGKRGRLQTSVKKCSKCGGFIKEGQNCKKCSIVKPLTSIPPSSVQFCQTQINSINTGSNLNIRQELRKQNSSTFQDSSIVDNVVDKPSSVRLSKTQATHKHCDVYSVKVGSLHKIIMKDVFFKEVTFDFKLQNELILSDKRNCPNCLRYSTTAYKLAFKTIPVDKIIFRKYSILSKKVLMKSGSKEYSFCQQCFGYISGEKSDATLWGVAWPSFIAYILVKIGFIQIWSWIPLELRLAWLPSRSDFHPNLQKVSLLRPEPFFVDCTSRRARLIDAIDKMEGASLRKALDETTVADVRCFCGSQEFLEDSSLLSLQYGLTHEYPEMRSMGVLLPSHRAYGDFLAAARSDWLYSWLFLDCWRVGPSLVVDSNQGLCFLVCEEHKKGSLLKYVHVPYNPIQFNKPCLGPDRLGGLVIAPQIVKPLIKKYNVNTYEVLRVTGSYSGLSSSMLHSRRRWDITSNFLSESERLQFLCRRDVRQRLHHLLDTKEISDEIYNSYLNEKPLTVDEEERISFCQQSGTRMTLDNLLDCRRGLYEGQCNVRYRVTRVQPDGDNVRNVRYNFPWPLKIIQSIPQKNPPSFTTSRLKSAMNHCFLWLLATITFGIPHIWSLISQNIVSSDIESWEGHLLRFISVKILKINIPPIGKDNPYRRILDCNTLEQRIRKSISLSSKVEVCVATYFTTMPGISYRCVTSSQLQTRTNFLDVKRSCKILFLTRLDEKRISRHSVPMILKISNRSYGLRYMGFSRRRIDLDGGESYHLECCIFSVASSTHFTHYSSLDRISKVVNEIPLIIQQHWNILCYELISQRTLSEYRTEYIQSFDSSIVFKCSKHHVPLTRDVLKTKISCCVFTQDLGKLCTRKSYVRCVATKCTIALCKEHFAAFSSEISCLPNFISRIPTTPYSTSSSSVSGNRQPSVVTVENKSYPSSLSSFSPTSDSTDIDSSDSVDTSSYISRTSTSVSSDETSDFDILDSADIDHIENTDSSMNVIDFENSVDERHSIPRHVVFNVDSQLLNRNGKRLTGTLSQKRFLHSFVSSDGGQSLSLINFEGDVFPSIFYTQTEDGLFPGAIPQFLYSSRSDNRYFGYAGIDSMLRTRTKDGASLTGCDPRYIAQSFDAIVNLELRSFDTRLIKRHGYEHLLQNYDTYVKESRMSFDSVDSRRRICEVAAYTQKSPEFFYTHTVSMRHHPGVRLIFEQAERLGFVDSETDLSRIRDTSIAVQLTRSSERAVRYVWEYILRSPEKPLGEVESVWYRSEWQADAEHAGNLPHTHGLIKIKEGTQSLDECLDRIICSSSRLFNNKEYLMELGLIESESDYEEIVDRASRVQQHDCKAAGFRCHKINKETNASFCRTPHYFPTLDYHFLDYTPEHAESALELLIQMGLATKDVDGNIVWSEPMIGGKYFYPADNNEHFIPTNNQLWALHRSQCNLLYCDQYRRSRYIAKYIASSEAKASVFLKPKKKFPDFSNDPNSHVDTVHVGVGNLEGSKYGISHSDKTVPVGRLTPFTEIIYHLLKRKTLSTNLQFIKLPSVPFESRFGVSQSNNSSSSTQPTVDLSHDNQPDCVRVRFEKNFPSWRLFTASQVILYQDRVVSPVSLDKYTLFSLRPPELLLFSSPADYFTWFYRCPKSHTKHEMSTSDDQSLNSLLDIVLAESSFVDMLGNIILVRAACITDCVDFLTDITTNVSASIQHDSIARQLLSDIFFPLRNLCRTNGNGIANSDFFTKLVIDLPKPIILNSCISPVNQCKFLIHLALTLGNFETELDLFRGPSIFHVFLRSRIIPQNQSSNFSEHHILPILKKYVLTQLLYYPGGGTYTFDSYLVAAFNSLRNGLLDQANASDLPGVLLKQVADRASSELAQLLSFKKNSTIEACLGEIRLSDPSHTQFFNATRFEPMDWFPEADHCGVLNADSYEEHRLALSDLTLYIDSYSSATSGFSRYPVITGGPGVGKSYVLTKLALYCISRGLYTLFTSLTAETSLRFGGSHCHALLPLPISNNYRYQDVDRITEKCIFALGRNPIKTCFLKHIDVLCIEELGLLSAELVTVMDRVCRVIRGSTLPFGGILVLASMDPFQLPPVEGKPFLISPLFITMFRMIKLNSYVRSARDLQLQRINEIGRLPNLSHTPSLIDEYCSIILSNCTFVSNIRYVPHTVLRIVGKRVAEQEAIVDRENEILHSLPPDQFYVSFAIDKESISQGLHWKNASPETVILLNRKCLAPNRLVVYNGCIMRLTENDIAHSTYSQGQLCVIDSISSVHDGRIDLLLSPPGNREVPSDLSYRSAGWTPFSLSFPNNCRDIYLRKGLLGRRLQYPLKPFVALTIHRSMGCTLPAICAQLSLSDSKHHLWLKAQIYTLFSRVEKLPNIILVGEIPSIISIIRHLLSKPQQYENYIYEIMRSFEAVDQSMYFSPFAHGSSSDLLSTWPFRSPSLPLPDTSNIGGCVYLLSSMKDSSFCYIGQTSSIIKRIQQHNRHQGSSSTRDPYFSPWSCIAIITGFDSPDSLYHRLQIERYWKNSRRVNDSVFQILECGRRIAINYTERALVFLQLVEP